MYLDCPDTLYGRHGPADRNGKCPWCGKKYEAAIEKPRLDHDRKSKAISAYEYFYDPDFGIDPYDY